MYSNVQWFPEWAFEPLWRSLRVAWALLGKKWLAHLYLASLRPIEALSRQIARLCYRLFPPCLLMMAIVCLDSSAASRFWNCSRSECQSSFWHFLKRLDRETPNFCDRSSTDGNTLTPASFRLPCVKSVFGSKCLFIIISAQTPTLIYFLKAKLSEWFSISVSSRVRL